MRLVFLLALFLVMGCGGSKKKDTLELSLQPAKGPFKSATVQAYGLNDNVSAVGLELKNSLPEFKNGVASVVLKDKKKAMTFAHIVFTFENPTFTLSGDYTDFQTATGDRRIDQGQILLPFETTNISSSSNILNAVQGGDLIDHLALVQALGQGGLMDSNGRFPGSGATTSVANLKSSYQATTKELTSRFSGIPTTQIQSLDRVKATSHLVAQFLYSCSQTGRLSSETGVGEQLKSLAKMIATTSFFSGVLTSSAGFFKPLTVADQNNLMVSLRSAYGANLSTIAYESTTRTIEQSQVAFGGPSVQSQTSSTQISGLKISAFSTPN